MADEIIRTPHEAYPSNPNRTKTATIKGRNGEDATFRIKKGATLSDAKSFKEALDDAKSTIDPRKAWRVDNEHAVKDYLKDTLITTPYGSTVAVTRDGDIISVAKKAGDKASGSDLLKMAVANGGKKLDSFDGNHAFYAKNGFEAVSRTPFDERYAPTGWDKELDAPEAVVFYKYVGVGKVKNQTMSDVKKNIPSSEDYDTAMKIRDDAMKKNKV